MENCDTDRGLPRTHGWALQSSCKMTQVFIFGSKCNFYFSHFVTLVSWYLRASVKKPASHQFPDNKLVIEEGLSWWSWQPSPGLDFPLGVCSMEAPWLGCWRSDCRQLPPPGGHPALARSQLYVRHWPCWLCKCPCYLPAIAFVTPLAGLWGTLPSTPPGPWLSPVSLLSSDQPQQELGSLKFRLGSSWCCWTRKIRSSLLGIWWSFWLLMPSAATLTSGHQVASAEQPLTPLPWSRQWAGKAWGFANSQPWKQGLGTGHFLSGRLGCVLSLAVCRRGCFAEVMKASHGKGHLGCAYVYHCAEVNCLLNSKFLCEFPTWIASNIDIIINSFLSFQGSFRRHGKVLFPPWVHPGVWVNLLFFSQNSCTFCLYCVLLYFFWKEVLVSPLSQGYQGID